MSDETRLPPGPRSPMPLQTLRFFRWPFHFVRACQRRYGDIFTLHLASAGRVVYLADPDAIREVFSHDGVEGHAGEVNSVLEPVTGPESILLLDRERHLRERRLLSPAFHGEAIGNLREVALRAARREIDGWEDGTVIAVRSAMQRITFEVIIKAVLGVDDPRLRDRLIVAFEPVFNVPPTALVPNLQIDLGPLSPWGRFRRAMASLDEILFDIIAKRRAQAPREDILGMLLAATEEDGRRLNDSHIRDELVTLLLAGHETTATSLAWALERLAHNPVVLAEVRAALATGKEDALAAVAAETLRVRPVVMDVARRLSMPLEVGGYRLPAGTTVMPAIYLVHFDRRNHAQPEEFCPSRFDGQRPSQRTWLPFGGGRRRCLGAGLAEMEMSVVLSTVLSEFAPEPVSSRAESPRLRGVTFVPAKGARLRMHRRPVDGSSVGNPRNASIVDSRS